MLPDHLPLTSVPAGLTEFVDRVLLTTLVSGGRGSVWCLEWHEHPDAITRLTAIWDAWQHMLAEDDAALHMFLRDVLDRLMPVLVDAERGPFSRCTYGHKAAQQLNHVKPGTGGGDLYDRTASVHASNAQDEVVTITAFPHDGTAPPARWFPDIRG